MIEARLSKSGRLVLCGRPLPGGQHCPERLGYNLGDAVLPAAGFVLDERSPRTWRLGRRARDRWERDRIAAAKGDRAAQDRLRTMIAARGRRLPFGILPDSVGLEPELRTTVGIAMTGITTDAPTYGPELRDGDRIICPRCGACNHIVLDRLRLDATR